MLVDAPAYTDHASLCDGGAWDEEARQHWQFCEDVRHYNAMVGVGEGPLEALLTRAQRAGGAHKRSARICAVLFYPLFCRHTSEAARVRAAAAKQRALPPLPSVATFACAECGAPCHSRREARFHCKWRAFAARGGE
jgi:hypothetical protein